METPPTAPCIFCGNDRPLETDVCPTCGLGWIDSVLPSSKAEPHTPPAMETAPGPPQPAPEPPRPVPLHPAGEAGPAAGTPEQLGFATDDTAAETAAAPPPQEAGERPPVLTDGADTGWNGAGHDGESEDEDPALEPETGDDEPAEAGPALEPETADEVGDEWDPLVPWDAKDWGAGAEAAPEADAPEEGTEEAGEIEEMPEAAEADQAPGAAEKTPALEGPAAAAVRGTREEPEATGAQERAETPHAAEMPEAADVPGGRGTPEVAGIVATPDSREAPEVTETTDVPETPAMPRPEAPEAVAAPEVESVEEPPAAPEAVIPVPAPSGSGFDDLIDLPEPDSSMLEQISPTGDWPSERGEVAAGEAPPHPTLRASQLRSRRVQSLVVVAVVAAVIVGWFVVLALITRSGDDEVAAPAETTTTAGPSTTAPSDTSAPTTTIATTTAAPTTIPQLVAEGEPLAIEDLTLGGFALGSFDFGTTGALGRLVATFGQPDALVPATETWGTCAGDEGFVVTWGPLDVIFLGTAENATLAGYRVAAGGGDHPAAALTTLSGLTPGETVADLERVYADFDVSFGEVEGTESFILSRATDGVTLLWGPVSSTDSAGIVEGVYSPRPCDQGPAPAS